MWLTAFAFGCDQYKDIIDTGATHGITAWKYTVKSSVHGTWNMGKKNISLLMPK